MIIVIDRAPLARRHFNKAGYLVAPMSTIARSGVLQYSAGQLGMTGNPNRLVNVYRPPSEVRKIVEDYANMPLTRKIEVGFQMIDGDGTNLRILKLLKFSVYMSKKMGFSILTGSDNGNRLAAGAGFFVDLYKRGKGLQTAGWSSPTSTLPPNHRASRRAGRSGPCRPPPAGGKA